MNTRTNQTQKQNRYVPNRFNNLKWIQNPVTNHKVEQLLRAVLYPLDLYHSVANYIAVEGVGLCETVPVPTLHVQAEYAQVLTEQKDLDTLQIGTADEYGYRLAPETNSWLIRNGIKPNAFLLALSQVQVEGIPAMLERDGKLYTLFCALYGVAYEAVFQADVMNEQYKQYVKRYGVPKHFTVQGVYNDPSKLYEVV